MKGKNLINILFICSLIIIGSCSKKDDIKITGEEINTGTIILENSGTTILENTGSIIISEEDKAKLKKEEKIANLRKKIALRGLIKRGDLNLQNQEYTSALVKYLKILKEIPNDEDTIKKLGDVYYEMKKFKNAYSYYSRIKDYEKLDKDRVIETLLSFNKIEQKNFEYFRKEMGTLGLSEEQAFYYSNSLTCKKDLSLCKLKFQEYFEKKEEEERVEGTGSTEKHLDAAGQGNKFNDLYNIKNALTVYENSAIEDLYYKGALLAGAYFENGLHPIAIEVSKKLLEDKDDYKPLLKLVAKSYYELGNFIEAKLYLLKYNKLVRNDNEASYFLGIVYAKLHEYMLSNIHFKKALMLGHKEILDINKKILINYYEESEINKMLETMRKINKKFGKELTENDFGLYIYYHIINEKIGYAKEINEQALLNFPESAILNGYYGWILMDDINKKTSGIYYEKPVSIVSSQEKEITEENIYSEAEKYISKGLEIDTNSPMLNLVKGKLEISKGDYSKAFVFFKKTIAIDKNGDFGKIAKVELENIQINKD